MGLSQRSLVWGDSDNASPSLLRCGEEGVAEEAVCDSSMVIGGANQQLLPSRWPCGRCGASKVCQECVKPYQMLN